ncbi:MAG: Holliday junction branch migration DNA helicase RuvB [Candidatus Omnitrophica bacterium]|nr:Holliday junction branch migration DNA helicase RuvB [Candidatus Omnitrophota bacterium]
MKGKPTQHKSVINLKETEEDNVLNLSLRPRSLAEFVGQGETIENLKVVIAAAKQRKEPLEHILLNGPPGLGKTSLAHVITMTMQAKITATAGPAIERAGDLIGILTNLEIGDILFIDEIHRLSKVVEEFLYPAMENFQIDFLIDKGPYAKTIKFNLKPFTLIGATTRAGLLSGPLHSRFGIFYHLDFYNPEDLSLIIHHSANRLDINIEKEASMEIARCCRGTPRIANRMLRRVRDYAQVKNKEVIDADLVTLTREALGIDSNGLNQIDRRLLRIIIDTYSGGPVGIEALAASLNEDRQTIMDTIEPYLLKAGYLKRTARGRMATEMAYKRLGLPYHREKQEEFL